ncbi:uncharacterized protein LOC116264161 [Nymphaea colorata]|nr:uncharacterized protein LOC116264161 [Nymphaea colorata]
MAPGTHHHRNEPVRHRTIEVRVISAQDLEDVKHLSRMRTYAVVYVEAGRTARTHVDETGGTNPVWNETVSVTFDARLPETDVLTALNVDVYAHGHIHDKLVGSARVLLCDVLKEEGGEKGKLEADPIQCVTLQLRRPSGRAQGLINLWIPPTGKFFVPRDSFSFCEPETPVTAPSESGEAAEESAKSGGVGGEAGELRVVDGECDAGTVVSTSG